MKLKLLAVFSSPTVFSGEKHLKSLKADALALTVLQTLLLSLVRGCLSEHPEQRRYVPKLVAAPIFFISFNG